MERSSIRTAIIAAATAAVLTMGAPAAAACATNDATDATTAMALHNASEVATNAASDGQSHFGTDPRRIGLSRMPKDASFSPDGTRLYVTDTDDTLHVIDAHSGKELTAIDGAQYAATDESGRRLFLAKAEGETSTIIKVFDAKSFDRISSMDIGVVSSWQITHDGTRIITTENEYSGLDQGDKSAVHIFDTASGKETKTFDVTHEMHSPTVVSPKDGKSYIVVGTDGNVQRVDAKTFKVTSTATIDASGSGSFAPVLRPDDAHGDIVYAYDWSGPGLQRVHLDSGDVDLIDTGGAGLMFLSVFGGEWFATLSQGDAGSGSDDGNGTLAIAPLTGTGRNDTPKLGEPVEFAPVKGIMPAGSMDGSVIYYETFESGKNPTLYVYDAANRQMLEPLTLPSIPDDSGSGGNAAPSWDGSRFAIPDRDGRQVLVYDLVRRTPATAKGDDAGTGDSGEPGDSGDSVDSGDSGDSGDSTGHGATDDASTWFTKPRAWILFGVLAAVVVIVVAIVVIIAVVVARSRANKRAPAVPYAQAPSLGAPYGAPYGARVSPPTPYGARAPAPTPYGASAPAPTPYGASAPAPAMPPRPRAVPPTGPAWSGSGGGDESDRTNRPG